MNDYSAAFILNKKTINVDKEPLGVYRIDDVCFGISDGYGKFIPIFGKYVGEVISTYWEYGNVSAFRIDFLEFSEQAGKKYNLEEFIKEMNSSLIGSFYQKSKDGGLEKVEDKVILEKAKKAFLVAKTKEFDEKSMDNDSNISKLYKDIKKTIISQDKQIMMILTSLFKNKRVIESNLSEDMIRKLKENILIAGPTGTGKTEILTRISKNYDLPIVIADSTSLSEVGYQGRKVEDLLRDLYLAANNDLEEAQKGILVIDEFDKLAEKSNQELVSRSGVQRSLLKILDGSKIYFDDMVFDTSKLTIVGLGAFSGIKGKDNYSAITTEDLVKYGLMRELVGRFSKGIRMNSLSKSDLKKILLESDLSPLNTYKCLFDEMNVSFSYDNNFVNFIAEKAEQLDTGARSLKTIFDEQISGALFNIFSGDYTDIFLSLPDNNGVCYQLKKPVTKRKVFKGKK